MSLNNKSKSIFLVQSSDIPKSLQIKNKLIEK